MKSMAWLVVLVLSSSLAWGVDPDHKMLVRYLGLAPEKYLPSLEAQLAGPRLGLQSVPSALGSDATSDDVAKEARRFACDMVLTVEVSDASGRDKVAWTLFSPLETAVRASGSVEKARPDWSAASDLYWLFLGDRLSQEVGPAAQPWPQPPVSEKETFTVRARPGTLISGFAEGPQVVGTSGELSSVLELPVSVYLQGHLVGWRTQAIRVFVDKPGQEVTLDQKAQPEWAITADLENFAFPALGVEWVPQGGRLMVRGRLDQYLGGLSFAGRKDVADSAWPVQSLPLLTLQVGAAWDWSWPEDQVRFYTALDLGLRVMFPQFKILSVEPVAPVTLEPVVGWDYQWTAGQYLYLEMGPTLDWVTDQEAYLSSMGNNKSSLHFNVPGTPLYAAFPFQAKVGYRWAF